jgi:isopenicillin-N epimerase
MSVPDWSAARAAMLLDPSVANLNSGSFGPTPRPVFERAIALRRRLAEEPMGFLLRESPRLLWYARERLAEFVGTSPYRLIFTQNVTTAINIVAASLRLDAPGEILMSDREYKSMQWCWERAAARQGLGVGFFQLPLMPSSPDEIVAAVESAFTPQTRLLFFSHALAATGLVLPAKEICAIARRRGVVTVVDGAHAPAMIDVTIDDIGCDYYGGNCHKWLLAPIGAGFLTARSDVIGRLRPLQVSWGYHADPARFDERDEFGTTPRLRALEFEGTRDFCPWLVVPDAIDFQAGLGWANIHARIGELTEYARRRLALRPATPNDPGMSGAMTAFWLPPGLNAEELRRSLWARRIEAVINEFPDGSILRVSTHFYNVDAEIDRLADALTELTRS